MPTVDPEKKRAQRAAFRERNRERLRAKEAARYHANRDARMEQHRRWLAANREAVKSYKAMRRQRAFDGLDATDREMSSAYRQAIACDPCTYCGETREQMHIDHVLPLAKGGTEHWWNLASACAPCNWSKNAKTVEEWRGNGAG